MIILEDVIHRNYKKARKDYLKKCRRSRMLELLLEVVIMSLIALFFVFIIFGVAVS